MRYFIRNTGFARHHLALCAALLLLVPAAAARESAPADAVAPPAAPAAPEGMQALQPFLSRIAELERREGAYSPDIAEHLLGLGDMLQRAGRHAEAIGVFKRGVHLARINGGLYGAGQIPLLKAEIDSHIALGDYRAADERQQYLYRVQLRTFDSGPGRARALVDQARWQQRAYQLGLNDQDFHRLLNMWELNRLAVSDILQREGENSPALLEPLEGMLRAQYLIAAHETDEAPEFADEFAFIDRQRQGRFHVHRAQSYDKGLAVLRAIAELEAAQPAAGPAVAARNQVRIGDWMLWHGRENDAMDQYRAAAEELRAIDDAEKAKVALLGEPVALPALDGMSGLPSPASPEAGDARLQFSVNARGHLRELERLDDNEDNRAKVNRLMRQLRKTRFRPRFEEGEPVPTENMVWAYDTSRW